MLVERDLLTEAAARRRARGPGRVRASVSVSTSSTPASSTSATSPSRSPTSSASKSSTCAARSRRKRRSPRSPSSARASWLAIPLRKTDFGYDVVVADPAEPGLADKLRDELHQPAKLYVGGLSDVRRAIDATYKAIAHVGEHVRVFEERAEARRAAAGRGAGRPAPFDENAPVVQVVNLLLSQAVSERASDVHIEPMDDRVRVRNRVDGALHEVLHAARSAWARRSSAASRSWRT